MTEVREQNHVDVVIVDSQLSQSVGDSTAAIDEQDILGVVEDCARLETRR